MIITKHVIHTVVSTNMHAGLFIYSALHVHAPTRAIDAYHMYLDAYHMYLLIPIDS